MYETLATPAEPLCYVLRLFSLFISLGAGFCELKFI
jgi:hypothetical protein